MLPRFVSTAACLALLACSQLPDVLPYQPVNPAVAPAWKQVRLGVVEGARATSPMLAQPPAPALESALAARLGGESATVSLSARDVRAVMVKGNHRGHLGLRATFELERGEQSLELPLEQGIGWHVLDADEAAVLYGRLVSDLCDQLLSNGRALAFLGAPSGPALDSAGPAGQGPMMALPPHEPGAEARGRIQWGHQERNSGAAISLFSGGGMRGGRFEYAARAADVLAGLGIRGGGGLEILEVDSAGPLIGARAQLAVELGMLTTATDPSGRIMEPGVDLVVAPRLSGALLGGGNDRGDLRSLTTWELGLEPRLDVPLGPWAGVSAGLFVGGSRTAVTGRRFPIHGNAGVAFAFYPFGSVFVQTASSRLHLGVTFASVLAQLSGLGGKERTVFTAPVFTLTYDDRAGRGMGERHTQPDATLAVLATPGNPFALAAAARQIPQAAAVVEPAPASVDPPAIVPAIGAPVATAPTPSDPVVRSKLKTARRWAILEPAIGAGLEAGTAAVVRRALADEIARGGATSIPFEEIKDALIVSGITELDHAALPNIAGALGADAVALAGLWTDAAGTHFRVHIHATAAAATLTEDGDTSRAALLRDLRARIAALFK